MRSEREVELEQANYELVVCLTNLQSKYKLTPSELVLLCVRLLDIAARKLRHR